MNLQKKFTAHRIRSTTFFWFCFVFSSIRSKLKVWEHFSIHFLLKLRNTPHLRESGILSEVQIELSLIVSELFGACACTGLRSGLFFFLFYYPIRVMHLVMHLVDLSLEPLKTRSRTPPPASPSCTPFLKFSMTSQSVQTGCLEG